MSETLCIWRLSDGKRGHDNQSLALIEALARLRAVDSVDVPLRGGAIGALEALRIGNRAPALVVGAGHGTHLALVVAARRQRARSVVLMKPSVPRRLFDLCVVPAHDGVADGGNVITSRGALNRMRPSRARDPARGLILVGGPSRHHRWSESALVEQVRAIVAAAPDLRWHATSSRRTPATTLRALAAIDRVELVAFADADGDWLPRELASAGRVWVTEDSVSMAYEAVSSAAPTGVIEVPRTGEGRVTRAVDALESGGMITSMAAWRAGRELAAPPQPLQEADRCARALLDRWPDLA